MTNAERLKYVEDLARELFIQKIEAKAALSFAEDFLLELEAFRKEWAERSKGQG